ncbi:MAG: hypothetical protein WCE53_04540 [Candidatus Acidiferrum sp.]
MTKQALNRFYVFALADKKGREAVAEVVETESLSRFKPDSNLNGCGSNLSCGHHASAQGRSALIFDTVGGPGFPSKTQGK